MAAAPMILSSCSDTDDGDEYTELIEYYMSEVR